LRRRDRAPHGIEIGDVELKRVGLVTARDDRLRRGLDLLARARGERHVRAGLCQRRRRGEPDAASAAGDECALAGGEKGGGFGEVGGWWGDGKRGFGFSAACEKATLRPP